MENYFYSFATTLSLEKKSLAYKLFGKLWFNNLNYKETILDKKNYKETMKEKGLLKEHFSSWLQNEEQRKVSLQIGMS